MKALKRAGGIGIMPDLILAIDQGTTSSRAIVFDTKLKPLGSGPEGIPAVLSEVRLGGA